MAPFLDERGRRLFTASEARAAGRGGVTAVATATRVARSTIGRGLAELRGGRDDLGGRVRRPGRWTPAGGGDATRPAGGFGRAGAIGHPRRSRGRLAVGQQGRAGEGLATFGGDNSARFAPSPPMVSVPTRKQVRRISR